MTDPRPDEEPAAPEAAAAVSTPAEDEALERRAFVRRMGTDAVRTAGSVFSLSRILTRSAAAAGQAVMSELESMQVGNAAEEPIAMPTATEAAPEPEPSAAAPPLAAPADPVPAPAALVPEPAPVGPAPAPPVAAPAAVRPTVAIDPGQRAILEAATTAVVAVNLGGHAPQLTFARVLWDGETLRFGTLGWSRRTAMLRTDPHIGLLIEGEDGRFATVTGRARIVDGHGTRQAMLPLLLRDGASDEADAEARWQELIAADPDRAVIVIEPSQVLSGRR